MLTQDDLKAIGTIVGEQIEAKVPLMIRAGINELVPPMIRAEIRGEIDGLEGRINGKFESLEARMDVKLDGLESRMDTKFDAMHEHMEEMENRLVTKSYLDDKLAHYVKKPF